MVFLYVTLSVLNEQYSKYFPPNTTLVYTAVDYYIMQYLIGPQYNLPISKNCSIEFKALAGLTTNNRRPAITYFGNDTLTYYYANGKGFGYKLGLGLKYILNIAEAADIGFHVNLNYAGSTITYPNYNVVINTPFTVNTYNVQKKMELGILQLSVGVSLGLFPQKDK